MEMTRFKNRLGINRDYFLALFTSTVTKMTKLSPLKEIENLGEFSRDESDCSVPELSLVESVEELGFIPSEDKIA